MKDKLEIAITMKTTVILICQEYCRFEILLDVKRFLANKNMFARKMKIRQSRGKESREETKVSA